MNFYEGKRKEAHFMLDRVIDTLIAKNTDYGDSFSITGRVGASTRLMDKAMRLHTLSCNNNAPQVKDEAIEDTARDLFAYALMNILKFYPKLTWNPDDDVEAILERGCECNILFPIDIETELVVKEKRRLDERLPCGTNALERHGMALGEYLGIDMCYNFMFGFLQGYSKAHRSGLRELEAMMENLIKKEKKEDCPEKDRK